MKKLLLVDDNALIRKMLRLALSPSFELDEAASADEALAQILVEKPDGIVLDVMMPGQMNGFQLCERIKDDPALRDIYIVLVTACGQVADRELGIAFGANAYYVKPFSPLDVSDHLCKALNTEEKS